MHSSLSIHFHKLYNDINKLYIHYDSRNSDLVLETCSTIFEKYVSLLDRYLETLNKTKEHVEFQSIVGELFTLENPTEFYMSYLNMYTLLEFLDIRCICLKMFIILIPLALYLRLSFYMDDSFVNRLHTLNNYINYNKDMIDIVIKMKINCEYKDAIINTVLKTIKIMDKIRKSYSNVYFDFIDQMIIDTNIEIKEYSDKMKNRIRIVKSKGTPSLTNQSVAQK